MTKTLWAIFKRTPLIGLLIATAQTSWAQDYLSSMIRNLDSGPLYEDFALTWEATGTIADMIMFADEAIALETPEACLSMLQIAVTSGALTANALPFSSVQTFEDERGPVGRFRMLLNGEKIHREIFCVEEKMSATPLPWGAGSAAPVDVSQGAFDASVGFLILLEEQGVLDQYRKVAATPPAISGDPARNRQSAGAVDEIVGPPMTGGERDAFRAQLLSCWNVGGLSSEALRIIVEVGFSVEPDGRPVEESIRLLDSSAGSDEAIQQTFETARRAILRCGAGGLALPAEKYRSWSEVAVTFNPETMQIR